MRAATVKGKLLFVGKCLAAIEAMDSECGHLFHSHAAGSVRRLLLLHSRLNGRILFGEMDPTVVGNDVHSYR